MRFSAREPWQFEKVSLAQGEPRFSIHMNPDLESFLSDVSNHVAPVKELTVFSVGGRGYYENPTTDLLAFFLRPDAEHGLKEGVTSFD